MNRMLKALLIAGGVAMASAATTAPSQAAVSLGLNFNSGSVAFGYSDGYWDRQHRWHNWRNRNEMSNYRRHYPAHFVNRHHDRGRNHGWGNRWW